MTKKLMAMVLLSLTLAACESAGTENNSNANSSAKPNQPAASTPAASTPSPVSPSPEASAPVKAQVKAGDKVKITIGGTVTDATVISVDEKGGKVTVKIQGQKEEKTVALADVIKE